jgi:serine-protein kinase ATM
MRRTNMPRLCRAACHVAHTLLIHAKLLLSPNKVLAEIETLAKDLVIQGPPFPCDSVCAFLVLCAHIASQDVRLYRLQLEDKVLAWLADSWRPTKTWDKLKMPLYTDQDILDLLEAVLGRRKHVDLLCEMVLPDCAITEYMVEEHSTAVIRNFVLYARLPPFNTTTLSPCKTHTTSDTSSSLPTISATSEDYELVSPGGREERCSAFFSKYLDEFVLELETYSTSSYPVVERIRAALDFATTALSFETTLYVNGTRPNRRNLQLASKVLSGYIALVLKPRWTWNERAFMIAALDPLLLAEPRERYRDPWESMLPPGEETGIRRDVLRRLTTGINPVSRLPAKARRQFQRSLFHNSDVSNIVCYSVYAPCSR